MPGTFILYRMRSPNDDLSRVLTSRALRALLCATAILLGIGCETRDSPYPDVAQCDEVNQSRWRASPDGWPAVGFVSVVHADGYYEMFCSATLVSPRTILTAKHCSPLLEVARSPDIGAKAYFGMGPNASSPERLIKIQAESLVPPEVGGFLALGSDLAFYVLDEAVTDVTPLRLTSTSLSEADLAQTLTTVGFGEDVLAPTSMFLTGHGVRHAGAQTIKSFHGNLPAQIYGTKANCVAGIPMASQTESASCETRDRHENCDGYERAVLMDGYEVWAGEEKTDAQTCFGDSGGPLIRGGQSAPELVGVVSWGWWSGETPCSHGTVFALIGNEAISASTHLAQSNP